VCVCVCKLFVFVAKCVHNNFMFMLCNHHLQLLQDAEGQQKPRKHNLIWYGVACNFFLSCTSHSYVFSVVLTFCQLFLRFVSYSYVLSVILTFCLFVSYSYVLSVILTFCHTVCHRDVSPPRILLFGKTICKNFGPAASFLRLCLLMFCTFYLLFLRFVSYSDVLSVILTFCLLFLRFVSYSYVLSVILTFFLSVILTFCLLFLRLHVFFTFYMFFFCSDIFSLRTDWSKRFALWCSPTTTKLLPCDERLAVPPLPRKKHKGISSTTSPPSTKNTNAPSYFFLLFLVFVIFE
jgi:hypothetical protein